MKKPHKHRDLIIAWANGEKIQYKENNEWIDRVSPVWSDFTEYRIKPEVIRYRVALYKQYDVILTCSVVNNEEQEKIMFELNGFVKWLTDWIEVEV